MACDLQMCVVLAMVVLSVITLTTGSPVRINDDDDFGLERIDKGHDYNNGPTVHHFARHAICRNLQGKIKFYNALEDHLCEVSDDLRVALVLDLCDRKDAMLDKWVAEIYDSDRDGYISHTERSYYDD